MLNWLRIGHARLRQFQADLLASFWLRPAAMTVLAILLAETLVWSEGAFELPGAISRWVYAGGKDGARDVLGAIATASIGVAGTTFSITVAALTLASSQMGPRLLRNFTRDAGNQYALGSFVATFAYALTVLRTVRAREDGGDVVPQLAVSVGLLLAFCCVGVLIWFIHHVASSINVTQVVALVHEDLAREIGALPMRGTERREADAGPPPGGGAPLTIHRGGYLRVLDDSALADWAAERDAVLRLRIRPGDYVFPGSQVGEVTPAALREDAEHVISRATTLGQSRSIEQDLELAVRHLVEVALRALSPGINDPFTAIAVLDRFGAALCGLAARELPDGRLERDGRLRLQRPTTDYAGLADAMFHMIRQSGTSIPAVMIRLLDVLREVAAVEPDPLRRAVLRRHIEAAAEAADAAITDSAARVALEARRGAALRTVTMGPRCEMPER